MTPHDWSRVRRDTDLALDALTGPVRALYEAVEALTLQELLAVQEHVAQRIDALQHSDLTHSVTAGREVVAVAYEGKITDQQELMRCGKPTCRCAAGQLHGPYWYRYYRKGGP